jgi:hypothetical protein
MTPETVEVTDLPTSWDGGSYADVGKPIKVLMCHFPGGNTLHPKTAQWFYETLYKARKDPRFEKVGETHINDTPITMTRNRVFAQALEQGFDWVLMLDNDMVEQKNFPGYKPFWDTAADFIWNNPAPACIAAPYVGPPHHNNIYVFRWRNFNNYDGVNHQLAQFTREEAFERGGIEAVAALPTGVILYDMRAYKLRPEDPGPGVPPLKGLGWFYYQWENPLTAAHKSATEDVAQTRDVSLWWHKVKGAGCYCAWDSWFYHYKSGLYGKPECITIEDIGERFCKARDQLLSREFRTVTLAPAEEPIEAHEPLVAGPADGGAIHLPPWGYLPPSYEIYG